MTKSDKRRFFTLLEVMVAIALLLLAGGVIGLKMHGAVRKKQFQSELERLQVRFFVCQRLAMASQADWKGELRRKGDQWVFEAICVDGKSKKLSPLQLDSFVITLNGKKLEKLDFDFFASGQVFPEGVLLFSRNGSREEWSIPEIFQKQEGKKLGPVHPSEN